jgi:hypothetical protein
MVDSASYLASPSKSKAKGKPQVLCPVKINSLPDQKPSDQVLLDQKENHS